MVQQPDPADHFARLVHDSSADWLHAIEHLASQHLFGQWQALLLLQRQVSESVALMRQTTRCRQEA